MCNLGKTKRREWRGTAHPYQNTTGQALAPFRDVCCDAEVCMPLLGQTFTQTHAGTGIPLIVTEAVRLK